MKALVILLCILCGATARHLQEVASPPAQPAASCQFDSDCHNGSCQASATDPSVARCECDDDYIDWHGQPCAYHRKSTVAAFLISFFAGYAGADWFYLSAGTEHYRAVGGAKVGLLVALVAFACVLCCCGARESKGCSCFFGVAVVAAVLAVGVWWLTDWIRVAAGAFPDGHGVALSGW